MRGVDGAVKKRSSLNDLIDVVSWCVGGEPVVF